MTQPLVCPYCMTELSEENINREQSLVVCPNCAYTFFIAPDLNTARYENQETTLIDQWFEAIKNRLSFLPIFPEYEAHEDIIAECVCIHQGKKGLVIVVNWGYREDLNALVPITVVWNTVVWGMLTCRIFSTGDWSRLLRWSPLIMIGLFLLYSVAKIHYNQTKILINQTALWTRNGPIPPFQLQNRFIDRINIFDIYYKKCYRYRTSTKNTTIRSSYDYDVTVVLKDGREQRILRTDYEKIALYVGQQIKKVLDIPGDFGKTPRKPDSATKG